MFCIISSKVDLNRCLSGWVLLRPSEAFLLCDIRIDFLLEIPIILHHIQVFRAIQSQFKLKTEIHFWVRFQLSKTSPIFCLIHFRNSAQLIPNFGPKFGQINKQKSAVVYFNIKVAQSNGISSKKFRTFKVYCFQWIESKWQDEGAGACFSRCVSP